MSISSFSQKSTRRSKTYNVNDHALTFKDFDIVRSISTGQFGVAQFGYGQSEQDRVVTITVFDSEAEAKAFAAEARAAQ
jgi:hypothetical protein